MKSKKFYVVALVFTLVLSVLAGCSKSNNNAGESSAPASSSAAPSASASSSASETPKESEPPAWTNEAITLKVPNWDDEKIMSGMVQAFMEKYPKVTVEVDKSMTFPFEDDLTAAAAAGSMPDVFTLKDVPLAITSDWLLDLTPYWTADDEAQKVFPNISQMAVFNGKQYAGPTFQYPEGVFVNKTLFEKNNIPLPSYDWTITEMIDLAKKFSKPAEHYYGIGGPWGDLAFEQTFPENNNGAFGWNSYDGDKFHFTSQEWIDAFNLKLDLRRLKVDDVMTGEEKKKLWGDEGSWTFQKGHSAMALDFSWNMGWIPDDMKKSGAGEVDFYPFPRGNAGLKIPTILDWIGVASTTKHPEAAFELMKFLTFGKDGYLKRIELEKAAGKPVDKFPVADQPEVWAKLDAELVLPGAKETLKRMANSDPWPIIPGWNEFAAWDAEQKITEKLNSGEYKVADKAKELEDKANEFVAAAKAKMNK